MRTDYINYINAVLEGGYHKHTGSECLSCVRVWPLCPLTLVELVAAIVPGESEPLPWFRVKGGSAMPHN